MEVLGALHLREIIGYCLHRKGKEGPRYHSAQTTRSGLLGKWLRWPHQHGNGVSMIVRQEGGGTDIKKNRIP